jgi:hypothetical protein
MGRKAAGRRTLLARLLLYFGAPAWKLAETHHYKAFHPIEVLWKH